MHSMFFGLGLYFLPAIVAGLRQTHNATAILFLDLFFGWTVVGWFAALLLAIFSMPRCTYYYRRGW